MRWPSRKLICVTRPPTSARTTVPWRERSEPTASTSSLKGRTRTSADSTTTGPAAVPPAAGALATRAGPSVAGLLWDGR